MQQSSWYNTTMTSWSVVIISLLSCLHSHVNAAQPKIIIIGAGASGISAATRLIENNITDFIILEAEQRFGGRIKSVFVLDGEKGGFVDIGGEFLLGQKGNIVYDLAKQDLKILDERKKAKDYYSNGKPVDPEIVDDMTKLSGSLLPQYKDKEPISVEKAFNEKFKETLQGKYGNDPAKSKQVHDYKGTSEKMFLLRQGAYSWRNLLLNDHFESLPDDKLYAWNGNGFIRVLELLMSKFGEQNRFKLYPISYGTTVDRISWKNGRNVQLHTKGGKTFQADYVIFTGSAGVLKTKHENLFLPKLPEVKRKAIRDIGYKANMKIAIQYHKKWWTDDLAEFVFTFNEEIDKVLSKEFKLGQQKDGKSWLSAVTKMATIDGLPNCLMAWLVGPQVPEIEKLDVETIKKGLFAMTKRFLGKDYNVTAPKLVVPSNWHSNPNFAGVYTHETLASGNRKTQVQDDLAQPLLNSNDIPVVFFAGEHTSPNHYANVHGAIESGFRAADELVALLR